jgi:hypothetical protein
VTAFELPSLADVQRYARGALQAADANDVVPVPINQVAAAAGLHTAQDLYEIGEDIPPGIRAIMAKMARKVLGAFDLRERQIYLDTTIPIPRRRFVHGHETGHAVLPWHNRAYMGDDKTTLAPDTRDLLEQEANAFSAELLFAGNSFSRRADDSAPGLGRPLELAETYGTSAHAALRRYAQCSSHEVALLVFGRLIVYTNGIPGLKVFPDQCAQSPSFTRRLGSIVSLVPPVMSTAHDDAVTVAARATRGVEDTATLRVVDQRRGGYVDLTAEVFTNGHLRFVLLHRDPRFAGPRVRIAPV